MKVKTTQTKYHRCQICHAPGIELFPEYSNFYRVTSDCKPWYKGGKLGVCGSCGCVQKIDDINFYNECRLIYSEYTIYHQSEGQEQKIFEQSKGMAIPRSELILNKIFKQFALPSKGHLLDIGCGNGNLLRSFSKLYPHWVLAGSELNGKYKKIVEQIDNVEAFYTCSVEEISSQFDIITLIHCMEHIIDPKTFLKKLRDKINDEGLMLIEVPDYRQNPFDLIIADHCTHFGMEELKKLLNISGFEIIIAESGYISKELTCLARKKKNFINFKQYKKEDIFDKDTIVSALTWLQQTVQQAYKITEKGKLGLFGTSIAGTWLCKELGDAVSFFVDEDPSRREKKFMERKVFHPKDIPDNWNVLIAFPYQIAKQIWKRMQSYDAEFYMPPNISNN